MNIDGVKLRNNVFLAPMAGVTDLAFRVICSEMGAGLVFSEMVSAKGIYYKDKTSEELLTVNPDERPIAIQIFGSDPEIMGKVVKNALNKRTDIDIIDINMGCPAPKIVKNGDGSALMKQPKVAREVIRSVVENSNKPVTLKIRMGWDHNNINGVEIAKIAEDEGISLLTIHGRTRDMFYTGKADWDFIKLIKSSVSIPVAGNGDIFDPKDAINMLEHTNCDAVAIGRGSQGNPFIFRRITRLMEGMEDIPPTAEERVSVCLRHLNLICGIKGEVIGVREMRKHSAWYLKGLKNCNEIKNKINNINSKYELESLLKEFLSNYKE